MSGQMTIFDWMPDVQPAIIEGDINAMTEKELADVIGEAMNLTFTPAEFGGYECRIKGVGVLTLEFSNYSLDDCHDRFIAVGFDAQGKSWGGGGPADTLQQAVNYLRHKLELMKKERG